MKRVIWHFFIWQARLNGQLGVLMAKTHRGTGLAELTKKGRGECPSCKRTGIKLLYEVGDDANKMNVCKECNKKLSKKK